MAAAPESPPTLTVLPYPPSANRYYRHVNGRTLLSREGRDYKANAARLWLCGRRPLDGAVGVRIDLYRPRKAGDLDNRIKPTLDSLNGVLWHDDKQVAELHVYRHEDRTNPRAEVWVWPLPAGLPEERT